MSKLKILFIHHAAGWGGAPINMINIINNLDKSKYDIQVLLLKDSIVKDRLSEANISYTVCESVFFKKFYSYFSHSEAGQIQPHRILKLFKCTISWLLCKYVFAPRVLAGLSFDIVHLNSSVLSDWLAPSKKKGKVIYHVQEPISKGYFGLRFNLLRSEVKKYADRIIAISKDNAERLNLSEKTVVVYNFSDFHEINLNHEKKETNVLYLGGAAEIKGIKVLLNAIPHIDKRINIQLAGGFPSTSELGLLKSLVYRILFPRAFKLRNRIKQALQFNNVKIIGLLPNVENEIQNCSVLLSPFTVPHFSRPIIEAFALGKPVIASDVVGMNEVVEDKVNGFLFKNNNSVDLADKINALALNDDLRIEMGKNGMLRAKGFLSLETNIGIIEALYDGLFQSEAKH
jgi:glycosyltransferase involved in cell wall biosynthesis